MRKTLMLLAVVAAPLLMAPDLSQAAVGAKPTEQELLVLKKKKAEAARKAAEAKRAAEAKKAVDARKAAERKKAAVKAERQKAAALEQRRMAMVKKKRESERMRQRSASASSRNCRGLLECMFGSRPRAGVQRTSIGRAASDYATAEVVNWEAGRKYAPGSLIVRTPERALYLVMGDGKARRYKVGVGKEGFQWSGNSRIVNKAEWPTWRPPQAMIEREAAKGHILPTVMEGGPENPLGARALYIGGTMYRIHGTNNAASIGGAVSSGCIRMMNTDVIDLYGRVNIGAKVYVYQ